MQFDDRGDHAQPQTQAFGVSTFVCGDRTVEIAHFANQRGELDLAKTFSRRRLCSISVNAQTATDWPVALGAALFVMKGSSPEALVKAANILRIK